MFLGDVPGRQRHRPQALAILLPPSLTTGQAALHSELMFEVVHVEVSLEGNGAEVKPVSVTVSVTVPEIQVLTGSSHRKRRRRRARRRGPKITKSRVKRDFVAAGVPARTFAVVIAAVRSVKHPAVPEDTSNM